jgi:predicted aconitase
MKLTDEEKAVLDGRDGKACQKAMDLLVRYGEALGAGRLVDTNNVAGGIPAGLPYLRDWALKAESLDEIFSEINLDAGETVEIPHIKVFASRLINAMDPEHWEMMSVSQSTHDLAMKIEKFCNRIGLNVINTCAPYQVGNIPVKGEHCAWMESSAVVYANSILGARTNCEGTASTGAAMLVGKIPDWGYHLDENRFGTHLIEVEYPVESDMDWGMLGYYMGEVLQEQVPVLNGIRNVPDLPRVKHCGAAAASSGGIELYHVVGITPEAPTLEAAFGPNKPRATLRYGQKERKEIYEKLVSAKDRKIDFVMLGCPHYNLEQIMRAARMLEGKRVHPDVQLWIFTASAIKAAADRIGYTQIIRNAGAYLMTDTCPAIGKVKPPGAKVAATDAAKHAHYMPPQLKIDTWFGSTEQCIQAAVTGTFEGGI